MKDGGITTWGYIHRAGDDELWAMTLMEPADDAAATVEDVHRELERRERRRIIRQIRVLLLITTLCWVLIAVCIMLLTLNAFGVLHRVDMGNF